MAEGMYKNDKLERIYQLSTELEGLLKDMPSHILPCRRMRRIRRLFNMINKPTPTYCFDDCPACFQHRMTFEYNQLLICECTDNPSTFIEYIPAAHDHGIFCSKCERPKDFETAKMMGQNVLSTEEKKNATAL